ncbi:MAG: type I DNA topoisomerase [bacterium]
MNLIIVESPTKAKTIAKFLNKDFQVESSFGHVRDLPKRELGVDLENNFEPTYIVPTTAKAKVSLLKKAAAKADKIILASDEDREGEAIAWHLAEVLDLTKSKKKRKTDVLVQRIAFHEITKDAILHALENPREIDMDMVDAQQARRVLDRLVGYKLSPLLWKKVAKGLSAGRVQSVAVRLVVEREREIQAFKADEYWTISANLETKNNEALVANLHKKNGKTLDKLAISNEDEAKNIESELLNAEYQVINVEKRAGKKTAPVPFTTSTLQQAANRMLGMSAKQTMTLAQKLYEQGYITYMRTDSLNLSDKFLTEAKEYLSTSFGEKYHLNEPRKFKTKSKGAQEAHEAIRPTEANKTPELLNKIDPGQLRLYRLIWQRAIASQMPNAIVDQTSIDIEAKNTPYHFRTSGQILKFDGYLKIYPETTEESILPAVTETDILNLISLAPLQHFTKPPARYSDAGLVKILERHGIGRPSTYAPTIATIEARNYVERDEAKKLKPTDIAFTVNDLLVANFPEIVDFEFTAKMEDNFDEISDGKTPWQPVIREFYEPFAANLAIKTAELKKEDIMPEEKTEEVCDKCQSPMIIKIGRFGKYLACSNYPDCKNIKSLKKETPEQLAIHKELEEKFKDEVCDKCQSPMIVKVGRFGPFLACSGYPKCKNIKGIDNEASKTGIKCPNCETGEIISKRSRRGTFFACNNYPTCKTSFSAKPTGEKCPECSALLLEIEDGSARCSAKGCKYKKD